MVNAASVPVYRWYLCGHFSSRLHWVLTFFGVPGLCITKRDKDRQLDNQIIHTRLTLQEIRICYIMFFFLLTVYTNKFRQRSFWGGLKRKNFKFSIAPSHIEFAEENWGTQLDRVLMPEKKEDTILWLFIIGVWKFSHGFIFMRPVFRFFKQRKLYFLMLQKFVLKQYSLLHIF